MVLSYFKLNKRCEDLRILRVKGLEKILFNSKKIQIDKTEVVKLSDVSSQRNHSLSKPKSKIDLASSLEKKVAELEDILGFYSYLNQEVSRLVKKK